MISGQDAGSTPSVPPAAAPASPAATETKTAEAKTAETPAATRPVAEVETQTFQTTELDLPESTSGILLFFGLLAILFGLTVRTSLRDSRFLKRGARITLLIPRLLVIVAVVVILLNPQRRTQLSRVEKSRVGIVVDTSSSMQWPAVDAPTSPAATNAPAPESRAAAVVRNLVESGVLSDLSKTHAVSVYTFDSSLAGPWAIVSDGKVRFSDPTDKTVSRSSSDNKAVVSLDEQKSADEQPMMDPSVLKKWQELLQPKGTETRLGESLYQLVGQLSGNTLSGVVVLSDGRNNAGLETEAARVRAERSGTKLISVGVGSLKPQMNVWISGMQSPTDVHQGDPFDISVSVHGSSAVDKPLLLRLFQQTAGSDGKDRREVAQQAIRITDEAIPVTTRFTQSLNVPGKYDFIARVESAEGLTEMTLDDNERRRTVEVTDRKMRLLIISSGPMRDYQFVRNTMYRHSGVESDVWLQTVTLENVGMVSQESRKLLTEFPKTEAELFEYDVIVAFDPDWSRLSAEQQTFLNRWVSEHSGGLVIVAGEIYTPKLAQDPDALRDISVLYPVLLNRMVPEMAITQRSDEPHPLVLTPEGAATEFLKIADESGNPTTELWKKFKGIYRSYPIRGLRDGAAVLLQYDNPRARTELGVPPFLVSQFYGTGRTIFLGSAETWRLRELSSQGHQRFWTSLIREVGQGRRNRGTARGLLTLDHSEVAPGQPVTIRAQLYDAQLKPLSSDSVLLTITDPDGQTLTVPDRLNADGRGLGQFITNFRPSRPGLYRISVPVPESADVLNTVLDVVLPNLESQNPTQDVEELTQLTRDTQGRYLSLSEISTLPSLLPDQSQPIVVDEQLRTLWDRAWLMYAAATLLGFEWIMRRLWRLS